ncbi:hypothetical protein PSHT_08611 [Puccinia striiformis]|uniref:Uncharacterized protein n=1 Tax=Puccinia striiformis TaxID=27350 RepID=A0A2S4VNN3_9BASI|nr:hypothetical protein PSHT_08611 [Puccinia striiformis]
MAAALAIQAMPMVTASWVDAYMVVVPWVQTSWVAAGETQSMEVLTSTATHYSLFPVVLAST